MATKKSDAPQPAAPTEPTQAQPPPSTPAPAVPPPQPQPQAMVPAVPRDPGVLARREAAVGMALQGLVPSTIGELHQLSTFMAKSQAVPKALLGKPETVMTVIMAGMELGLTPIKALNSITIISGNLAMKADLQLAVVRKSGLLAFFDEGFEFKGTTDTNLDQRITPARAALIQALVSTLPHGKPYGWCVVRRQGEADDHIRVFSWADAERAFVYSDDDDGAGKTRKKLSEKFNYLAWPQSMYPRRARSAILQVIFSDALAGIPAVEQLEGGQGDGVIDAQVVEQHQDGDELLAAIRDEHPDVATGIEAGFENLAMPNGKRLQLLTEFKGRPEALRNKLRDEYNLRKRGEPAPAKADGGRPSGPGVPVTDLAATETPGPTVVPGETKTPQADTKAPKREPKTPEPDTKQPPAEPGAGKASSARDRFRTSMKPKA